MSIIDKQAIEKMARLAHIKVDEGHIASYQHDVSAILEWVGQLEEVDTSGVEALAHPMALTGRMRKDEAAEPIEPEVALSAAPESQSGFFTTPKTNE